MREVLSWARLRFVLSWVAAVALAGFVVPRAVGVTWRGVLPVLDSLRWPAALTLLVVWLLGLLAQSFVLTGALPSLTHRRALTLNVTGSAVANVVPLGGAAGVELNRRMLRAWGIDTRSFAGFTITTNLWDVGSKLLLPVVAVLGLLHAGETGTAGLRVATAVAAAGFVGLLALAAALLASPRGTRATGRAAERTLAPVLRLLGRPRHLDLVTPLLEVRRECARSVTTGWLRMSAGATGYVTLQLLLLVVCLHLTGAGVTTSEALAGFAVERLLTVVPLTPGGVGVADLGLVGVLIALGGDPAGVTAAAVLYRAFVFAVEIPLGGSALGLWLLGQRRAAHRPRQPGRLEGDPGPGSGEVRRVAHVTDVFLPRLGGIETHVDDLVRHQRRLGIDAEVLTPSPGSGEDPPWVRRLPAGRARRTVTEYDVLHVHLSMVSPFGLALVRAATAAGVPVLVTVHSMWAGAGGLLRLAALAGVRRWPVAWSAVSAAAADTLRRSLPGLEVAVLPNAVDVAAWRPPRSAGRAAPGTGRRAITVVSVMRLMPRKRPLALVRAFEQARRLAPDREVRLVLVGDGRLRRRVERHVRRRGLGEHVRVTGRIERGEVREELRSASFFVAPAPKESFGIAALEARCAGLPVVASRRSGVGEFVRDRVDGLLVGNDSELAVAIAELACDDDLRGRISAHNRRVAPSFDWADVHVRTCALYRSAQAHAGAVPATAPQLQPGLLTAAAKG